MMGWEIEPPRAGGPLRIIPPDQDPNAANPPLKHAEPEVS
jgi:hypothetical protein